VGFLRVWPIQRHFLLFIWIAIGCWFVIFHRSSFDIISGHLILIIPHKQRLIKPCNLLVIRRVISMFHKHRGLTSHWY
jgi:hypothetical protein